MASVSCALIVLIAAITGVKSSFIARQSCDFESPTNPAVGGEGVYCAGEDGRGWKGRVTEGQGPFGVSTAEAARQLNIDRPLTDYKPGTGNGSYFYYAKSINYFNQALLLSYPTQKFIKELSFSFYMVGPQGLQVFQSHVQNFEVLSNHSWNGNETGTWERTTVQFAAPYPNGSIIFVSPSLSGEIGEAPIERDPFLALDDIVLTFDLPCDFSSLRSPGNLILSHPSFLDITIGQINTVQFTAISPICTDGPFVYTIESNNITGLASIFHLSSTSGLLTVNATGPHLVGAGIPLGLIVVSVYVQDSDFLQSGGVYKTHGLLHYRQKPTIIIGSPSTTTLTLGEGGESYSYILNATSALNASLSYSISQSSPSSIATNISINGNVVEGVFTHQHVVDVIRYGVTTPSFTILIADSYGEMRNHTVQLILPSMLPLVFNEEEYIFYVSESGNTSLHLGNVLIGSLPPVQDCNTISAQISTSDSVVSNIFRLYSLTFITVLPNFCTIALATSTNSFNYEERDQYLFNITASNALGYSSVTMVTVLVVGVNEFSPVISPKMHSGMVSDYEPVNNLILVLMATDNDEGPDGTLSFSITKGNTDYFQLRQISNSVAHLETKHSPIEPNEYIVEVTVRDHGTPSKSDTAIVIITSITSNEIQCNQSIFGPPVITGTTPPLRPAVNSNVTLQCNYTANPGVYPIRWYRSPLSSPFAFQPIASSSQHYILNGNALLINGVTNSDIMYYTCNITNQCGSNVTSMPLVLIIQPPSPPGELRITAGPSKRSLSLSWTPSIITIQSPVTGYWIQLRKEEGGGGGRDYETIQILDYYTETFDKTSSISLFQLLPGTGYTVRVCSVNKYFQSNSNEVNFTTIPSPPSLSFLNATGLFDNSLKIEWVLEYTGGSHDVHMMLTVQSNQLKRRKRSLEPVTYSFNVGVNDNVLVTPTLPFGRSYEVMGVVSSEYGTHQLATIAFIGLQDVLYCPFSLSPADSCGWTVEGPSAVLTLASTVSSPKPTIDSSGQSDGVYVLGLPPNSASLETVMLLSYPSISYICSISFYYQVGLNVRLRLESSKSQNESLFWASPLGDQTQWTRVLIPPEEFPLSLSTDSLLFTMEMIDTPSPDLSYAAIDDVSLTFCLPCNYSKLTGDSISLSYQNYTSIYIRKDQSITIEAAVADCPNPVLHYRIQSVIPNQLRERLVIPDQRKGLISVSDITTDDAQAGTTGYIIVDVEIVSSDYKNVGSFLSKSAVISFVVSEFFENCSYVKSCDFENGPCDWSLSDQSDSSIKEMENNSFLYSTLATSPSPSSSSSSFIIGHLIINDSYCGLSFRLMKRNIELHVLVSRLGVVWSSYSSQDTPTFVSSNTSWVGVSVFIDVGSVEMMSGRNMTFEMVAMTTEDDDLSDYFVAIDNVTLHPCIDCQAQECSCISCIQQCSVNPCQDGYYLSLEINQCRPCPPGHYCESWRSLPKPCPPGTYSNITGGADFIHCQDCSNGTYTVQSGSITCQTCPTGYNCSNPAISPIRNCNGNEGSTELPTTARQTLSLYVASVVGGFVGVLVMAGTTLLLACFCRYQSKQKKSRQRKREHKMYADNFYINPDHDKKGFKSATVRTASTILSMMGKETEAGNKAYTNPVYDSDSSDHDSSSIFSSETQASKEERVEGGRGRLARDATINSLNSFDVKVEWPDANPFLSDSHSQSNISDMIELEDHDDHVWPALHRKKKQEREHDTSINV